MSASTGFTFLKAREINKLSDKARKEYARKIINQCPKTGFGNKDVRASALKHYLALPVEWKTPEMKKQLIPFYDFGTNKNKK